VNARFIYIINQGIDG